MASPPSPTVQASDNFENRWPHSGVGDYNLILKELESSEYGVTGSLGISKTEFLFFVLAKRLFAEKPTIFHYQNRTTLFRKDGAFDIELAGLLGPLKDKNGQRLYPENTCALIDCDDRDHNPPIWLTRESSELRPIQASPPNRKRYDVWYKENSAMTMIMNTWTARINPNVSPLLEQPDGYRRLYDMFLKYGPIPRTIYGYIKTPHAVADDVEQSINLLTYDQLNKMLHLGNEQTVEALGVSHRLITLQRGERWSTVIALPASRFILTQILHKSHTISVNERRKLYAIFSRNAALSPASGWLLEALVDDIFGSVNVAKENDEPNVLYLTRLVRKKKTVNTSEGLSRYWTIPLPSPA
ncbi:hypothetical protein BV25DRAFT_1990211 [Artomyces pyxidatus]|uniref:Uncharacterized protein n=1 Tax=Artomyces pyxidatus TaxID=48021 RepID=A0ACB8T597_9AGAM|nr:hypothetical protein BV25DRAFT_1990211 [Artomyces pyxidatus]